MPGPQVKNWDLYHALRRRGYSKEQAARIANSRQRTMKSDSKEDGMASGFLRGLAERLGFEVDDDATLEEIDKALEENEVLDEVVKSVVEDDTVESYSAGDTQHDGGGMSDVDLTAVPADVVAKIEGLEKELADANTKIEELEKGDTEETSEEDVLKSADPEVLEYIRKAEARAEEAETIAKEERDKRLDREFLEKSASLPYVGEDRKEFGQFLKSLNSQLAEEDFEKLETLLKAINSQLAESELFKEAGMSGAGITGDAEAQLDSIAKKVQEDNPDLTFEQAYAKVSEERPELYERYLMEQREG